MDEMNIFETAPSFPVIPLRGLVMFPDMVLHFDVGRKKSVAALKAAMNADQKIFLVSQKDAAVDEPGLDDLFGVGVICSVRQMMRIPGSENMRVVAEGDGRGALMAFVRTKPFLSAVVQPLEEPEDQLDPDRANAYRRAVKKEFEHYAEMVPKISNDVIAKVLAYQENGPLADYICSNTFMDYADKQDVLECLDPGERLRMLLMLLSKENTTLEIETELHERVQAEIDKNQREYYLREEMRVISESLGEEDNPQEEADGYREKIGKLRCDEEAKTHLLKECDKLAKMPQGSHEATVVRNYLDKCLEIPFGTYTKTICAWIVPARCWIRIITDWIK